MKIMFWCDMHCIQVQIWGIKVHKGDVVHKEPLLTGEDLA